jgi:signal transduction histidine kinase
VVSLIEILLSLPLADHCLTTVYPRAKGHDGRAARGRLQSQLALTITLKAFPPARAAFHLLGRPGTWRSLVPCRDGARTAGVWNQSIAGRSRFPHILFTVLLMRVPSFTNWLGGIFLATAGYAMGASAESAPTSGVLLTNAAQVRKLSAAEAAEAIPVHLVGVVIDISEPRERALMIADQTAGIYLLAATNLFAPYRLGDLVAVEGVTDPGEFAPIVLAQAARKQGTAPLPTPRPVTYKQLITGALDGQWVELSGVVRRYTTGPGMPRLLIAADAGLVPVRLARPPGPDVKEDAEVCLQAVCLYQFNQKRQVLTPVLQVPAGVPVRVEKPAPADPYAVPVRPADSLLQFAPESPSGHRIHVHGVVTYCQPGSAIWVRDQSCGLRAQSDLARDFEPGDVIDVLGFLTFGSSSPTLEHAIFRKTGATNPPSPLLLTNAAQAFDYEDDLVAVEARLTDIQPGLDGFVFTFDKAGTVFKANLKLPARERRRVNWQPGSELRVAGICSLVHDNAGPVMGIWRPQAFQILLRSPADLEVIKPAPWWTPGHVILLLGVLTVASGLVTGVVVLLARRRVREQARQRAMAEAEFAAILAERNRVAREIHDTLAQGLVATSVQLRLARKSAKSATSPPGALDQYLGAAQQLVSSSLEEARNSIWNMRSQVLETGDLASALKGILAQMADGTEVETHFEATGRVRRLAPVIENNLLRIGQEAITNAAKHAKARHIVVDMDFGEKQLRLKVSDDGQGFDPAKPVSKEGGFGLVGMRERASHLKGELEVRSTPGQGTRLTLTMPLAGG